MGKQLEKTYNPKEIEPKLYEKWCEKKYFHAEVDRSKKPFTILFLGHVISLFLRLHPKNKRRPDNSIRSASKKNIGKRDKQQGSAKPKTISRSPMFETRIAGTYISLSYLDFADLAVRQYMPVALCVCC